jgi:GTPase SAR1 family protein
MGSTFLRGTEGAVIVFDVTDTKSFQNLNHWTDYIYTQLNLEAESTFPLLILGNKIDSTKRTVEETLAASWAREHGFLYFETSARDNLNIEKAFKALVEATLTYTAKAASGPLTANTSRDTISIKQTSKTSKSGSCCDK